nr:sulfatase-like hydrolase/transferase [Agaribacterium haliotis]
MAAVCVDTQNSLAATDQKSTPADSARERPNIVLILLDDLGYADVGFMPEAESDIHTPSIDELAKQGTVFSQAYVSHPYCGPSRAGLMTGRYQHEFGSQFNLAAYSEHGISTDEIFFSKVLQDAGYRTGLIGKWHLGEQPQYRPNVRGFDYFYGMLGGGHVYHSKDFIRQANYDPENKQIWDYKIPLMENENYASESGYDDNLYITDMLTDAGLAFIDRESKNKAPFFLYMSYNAPHTPEEAKAEDELALQNILGDRAAQGKRLTYTAMVYAVDRGVKRLVEKLKATGAYENTLIVFLSDNGGRTNQASASNKPLRAGKTSLYEGGIRVPMFWHWPDGALHNGHYGHAISSLDFYPTFAALAEAEIPAGKRLDGVDVLPHIRAGTNARADRPLFFMMHQPDRGLNQSAVVLNNQKWYSSGNGQWFYYDLKHDSSESNRKNAAKQAAKQDRQLVQALYDWTCLHSEPQWFDSPSYGWESAWKTKGLPDWQKTFPKLYRAKHCNDAPQVKLTTNKGGS